VPDTNLDNYFLLCQRRFANPKIGDTIRRLALDGSNRQPKFIIPSALDRVTSGQSVTGLALVSALWCRYCYGTSDSGAVIEPNDPSWDRLTRQSQLAKDDPKAWLSMVDIYGDLARQPTFIAAFSHALNTLWSIGTKATLERYLSDSL
jgi:mannitol 2-dehydrogenase